MKRSKTNYESTPWNVQKDIYVDENILSEYGLNVTLSEDKELGAMPIGNEKFENTGTKSTTKTYQNYYISCTFYFCEGLIFRTFHEQNKTKNI